MGSLLGKTLRARKDALFLRKGDLVQVEADDYLEIIRVRVPNGQLRWYFCDTFETVEAEPPALEMAVDPSAYRDKMHRAAPQKAPIPFDHFPDLQGWVMKKGEAK